VLIDPAELPRLALFLRDSPQYIDRRAEFVDFASDREYRVIIRQQFTVPHLEGETLEPRDILVPLGTFSKGIRADLVVRASDGSLLPVITRSQNTAILSGLLVASFRDSFPTIFSTLPKDDLQSVILRLILSTLRAIVAEPQSVARGHVRRLVRTLSGIHAALPTASPVRGHLTELLDNYEFWRELRSVTTTTKLFTQMSLIPGKTHVLEAMYTERFEYEQRLETPVPIHMRVSSWPLRTLLPWLGLTAHSLYREVGNAGLAGSFWVVTKVPNGAELLRYFWSDTRDQKVDPTTMDPADQRVGLVHSDRGIVGQGVPGRKTRRERRLIVDAQIMPSASVVAALALAVLVLFIATYIFQRLPEITEEESQGLTILSIAGLFTAAPAAIAGGLAYRGEAFARRLSRGPRALVAVLAGLAGLLAVVVSLKEPGLFAKWLAYGTAVYCAFTVGVLGYVQCGPRWRKSDRSRWRWWTRPRSASQCRRNQKWLAFAFLTMLLFATVVFARALYVLREERVFTSDFPFNVWDAWWSWFGF